MKKLFLLNVFVLFIAVYVNAQCVSGNCEEGYGTFKYSDGSVYVGQFKESKANGYGTCYYVNGDKYVGYWKNHKADGEGTMYYRGGSITTGTWKESNYVDSKLTTGCISGDCSNGAGTYIYENGTKYSGQFKNASITGIGECVFYNGDYYKGEWLNNQMNGKGWYKFKNGDIQDGMWLENKFLGEIKSTTGCISGDCENGTGIYVYSDNSKYVGTFKDSKCDGKGTYYYKNGYKYVGEFASHAFDGYGTLYHTDGTTETGDWRNGKLQNSIYDQVVKTDETKINTKTNTITSTTNNGYKGTTSTTNTNKTDSIITKSNNTGSDQQQNSNTVKKDNVGDKKSNPKVWAVVVGIATYKLPVLKLNYSDDDAYHVYSFLKSPEGGALPDNQIALLIDEDATKDNISNALRSTFSEAGPEDLVLFYFAGHGVKGAFIPYDYDFGGTVLQHTEVNNLLRNCRAKNKVCIADACFSGTLANRSLDDITASGIVYSNYYKALTQSSGGLALLMSSTSEETSGEFQQIRQGIFSYYLIQGLKGDADVNKDKIVTITEVYNYVKYNVEKKTNNQQNPEISGEYDKNLPLSLVRY